MALINRLKSVKDKFDDRNVDATILALSTNFSDAEGVIKKREQQSNASNSTLDGLKKKAASLEESINSEKIVLDSKLQQLTELQNEMIELKADRDALLEQVHSLDLKKNATKNKKLSHNDQETLEHGKKKLGYYKQLTGIRWDFGAPEGTTRGYIINGNNYVHPFAYQNKECGSKLCDLLWAEIDNSITEDEN